MKRQAVAGIDQMRQGRSSARSLLWTAGRRRRFGHRPVTLPRLQLCRAGNDMSVNFAPSEAPAKGPLANVIPPPPLCDLPSEVAHRVDQSSSGCSKLQTEGKVPLSVTEAVADNHQAYLCLGSCCEDSAGFFLYQALSRLSSLTKIREAGKQLRLAAMSHLSHETTRLLSVILLNVHPWSFS